MTIALPARAKLNLELQVVGRRDDGFHDLQTVLQAIDLHDVLLTTVGEETSLTTGGLDLTTASPHENSVLKAQRALERKRGRKLPAAFHLHKRIPPGSGLGGASSDAAAALRALVALYRLELDEKTLAELALEVGADVPFFIHGGTARAEGRGDRLTPIVTAPRHYALAWPRIELSTAGVYRAWDENAAGDRESRTGNGLRTAAAKVDPRLDDFARNLGDGWRMTGSGSAFFLECDSAGEAAQAAGSAGRHATWTAVAAAVPRWS